MMKKYIIPFLVLIVLIITACNDDFLETVKPDEVTMESYWNTEEDLTTWINTWYELATMNWLYLGQNKGLDMSSILFGKSIERGWMGNTYSTSFRDLWGDNLLSTASAMNQHNLNKVGQNYPPLNGWERQQAVGGWWFRLIRPINLFIDNYKKADIHSEKKEEYGGQARLWRAYFYYEKVMAFGDVPLVLHELDISDTTTLYGPRDPRELVMDTVLADLNYACEHMPETYNNGNPGWFNKASALALKSRICLFEGTWRKYHGGSDVEMWLQEAVNAAEELMQSGQYSLYNTGNPTEDYRYPYYQEDLSGNPEIIYWKRHEMGLNPHSYHELSIRGKRANSASRSAIDDYLCSDGLPINLSPLYQGDEAIEDVFENRDPRFRQTFLHPEDVGSDKPLIWANGTSLAHPRFPGMSGGISTVSGYYFIKNVSNKYWNGRNNDETASILIKYNEVLLNYAEAKAELGIMTQADLDISINLLRDRAGMPHLELSNIPNDTRHDDMGVSDLIVEIRRERRVELFGEGFRYEDLRRWKTLVLEGHKRISYQGIQWNVAAIARYGGANVSTSTDPNTGKEYVDMYIGTAFEDVQLTEKHYLWPIPVYILSENPKLGQNPGWQ